MPTKKTEGVAAVQQATRAVGARVAAATVSAIQQVSGGPLLIPESVAWLADAPLFIDAARVARFYDAVALPTNELGTTTLELSSETMAKATTGIGVQGKLSLSGLFQLFSGLGGEAGIAAKHDREKGSSSKSGAKIELKEIKTAERQLIALALHYLVNQSDRILFPTELSHEQLLNGEWIAQIPRALAFVSLPSQAEAEAGNGVETKLVPTAMELDGGRVVTLFDKLVAKNGERPPDYPERGKAEDVRGQRREYWKWFDKNFSANRAMNVVEDAAGKAGGRIRWIDYRLPLNEAGDTLHLHCSPAGGFDIGTFAYNMIKRGQKHGLRLVGTLKSEPGMDVLAIYER